MSPPPLCQLVSRASPFSVFLRPTPRISSFSCSLPLPVECNRSQVSMLLSKIFCLDVVVVGRHPRCVYSDVAEINLRRRQTTTALQPACGRPPTYLSSTVCPKNTIPPSRVRCGARRGAACIHMAQRSLRSTPYSVHSQQTPDRARNYGGQHTNRRTHPLAGWETRGAGDIR